MDEDEQVVSAMSEDAVPKAPQEDAKPMEEVGVIPGSALD